MNKKIIQQTAYKVLDIFHPPHNLSEYRQILHNASMQGYHFCTLKSFWEKVSANCEEPQPYIILRHDIDSNAQAALQFAEIEMRYNAEASYFFRLQTWNEKVINTLHNRGHEVGYHYEELSDFAKSRHLKSKESILPHIPEIQRKFLENLNKLRRTVAFELNSVAAHGDFSWETVKLGNRYILNEARMRTEAGILYEAYDEPLIEKYRNHVSDMPSPELYHPNPPLELIRQKTSFLFLTHPRWWIPDPIGNICNDLTTSCQKLRW